MNPSKPVKIVEKPNIADPQVFNTKSKDSNQINYFTPHHSFCLDSEITEDLKKYLGFQADSLWLIIYMTFFNPMNSVYKKKQT